MFSKSFVSALERRTHQHFAGLHMNALLQSWALSCGIASPATEIWISSKSSLMSSHFPFQILRQFVAIRVLIRIPSYARRLRGRLQRTSAKISDFQTTPLPLSGCVRISKTTPPSPDVRVRIFQFLHILQFLRIFIFAH